MGDSKQELINVWMRNQLANEQILDETDEQKNISPKTLISVYSQFAHVHTIRYYNIEKQEKGLLEELIKLSAKDASDKELVRSQLELSAKPIKHLINLNDEFQTIKGYQNGIIGWIVYLINHESHHRSKAMMQLKMDGIKFSKRLKFDIWNWK